MAQLPTAEALGERPAPAVPRRTPNIATYDPTSGFEGTGAQELAFSANQVEGAFHYAVAAKEQQDTLAAEAAFSQLRQKQIDLTYGPKGVMSLKGADAVNRDVPSEFGKQLTGYADQLSMGLTNDYQRQLFSKRALVSQLELQETSYKHVAQQSDVYANQVLEGTLDTEARVAAAGGAVPTSLQRINAAIDRWAERFHPPEQQITDLKMKGADALWSSAVKGMIPSNPIGARELYKAHESEIGPGNKITIEREIKSAIQPLEAKDVASDALASILTKPSLTGAGVESADPNFAHFLGVRGDPEQVARDLAETLNVPPEDRKLILAQMQRQSAAPGGVANVPRTRLEVMSKIGEGLDATQRLAEQKHPGDPIFSDLAEQQFMTHLRRIAAATDGVAQQATATVENDLLTKKYTTITDLLANPSNATAWPLVSASAKRWMMQLTEHNARAEAGEYTKSDPQLFNSIRQRLYGPNADGPQITSQADLTQYFARGVNAPDSERLRKEFNEAQTPEGNPFLKQVNGVKRNAEQMLTQSMAAILVPELAHEAAYRFGFDLDAKIKATRAAGGDVQSLFTPGSKDYVLDPNRVAAFMPSPAEQAASKARGKASVTPATDFVMDGYRFPNQQALDRYKAAKGAQ